MQTEKLPTSTPPSAPPGQTEPGAEGGRNSPAEQLKAADRLFLICFLPALVVMALAMVWLSFADIYGEKRTADEQKVMKVKIYRPPVKQKPKPKPKPKVIPPKPRIIPKVVQKVQPRIQPRPQPRPQTQPRPVTPHTISTTAHSTAPTAIPVAPATEPQAAVPVAPTPEPAPPPRQPDPPPVPQGPPTPPAPVYRAPPPPPPPAPRPPPPKPAGYVDVESREARVNAGTIPQVDTSGLGIDPGSINGPCVCSCVIDIRGRISNVRVKRSSGNADFDDACQKALRQGRGSPGVQDHILHEQQVEYRFNVG